MADNQSTILIPDISGYTAFMTNTELQHATIAINNLIHAIIEAVGEEYDVAEIEGDAVLLVRKGPAPSQLDILEICLKIFNAFHFNLRVMQLHTICPCGSCQALTDLTLKFVVHHGPLAELKVGKFVTHTGPEMIVAHRLLKNSIDSHEYLLFTEQLLSNSPTPGLRDDFVWVQASDDYDAIGKIDYRFTLLEEARKLAPQPPVPENSYHTDNTSFVELSINANFRDVHMILMNIPGRSDWLPGLQKVEQEVDHPYIGSEHHCYFDDYTAIVSPLRMDKQEDGIFYVERCNIPAFHATLVYEYIYRNVADNISIFGCRFLNDSDEAISVEFKKRLLEDLDLLAQALKDVADNLEHSFFEPLRKQLT